MLSAVAYIAKKLQSTRFRRSSSTAQRLTHSRCGVSAKLRVSVFPVSTSQPSPQPTTALVAPGPHPASRSTYGTGAIARRTGLSRHTVVRFLQATLGPQQTRHWNRFDKVEFESFCHQIEALKQIQPYHPLRALKPKEDVASGVSVAPEKHAAIVPGTR